MILLIALKEHNMCKKYFDHVDDVDDEDYDPFNDPDNWDEIDEGIAEHE